MTAEFERFRFSFFDDPASARDGLDERALAALKGGERDRAERMLIDRLPDVRAVIGLGVLRSARAAPRLVGLFEAGAQGRDTLAGVHLAAALWRIQPEARWAAALGDHLAAADASTTRMHAALALHVVRDPLAVRALVGALDDGDRLVRHHAARGLLALHGLPAEAEDPQHMCYRIMSEAPERRLGGKADVLAAISGLDLA